MTVSAIKRSLISALLAMFVLVGASVAAPLAAAAEFNPASPHIVTYDASQSAEFKAAVDQGAQIWNESAKNVRFEPGTPGQSDLTIVAADGWPYAETVELGVGNISMGRQAVNEGHDMTRIASHEMGHILGLPDRRTGECADLMSGASAGPDCDNARPNAEEITEVDQNFANGVVIPRQLFVDGPAMARP